MDIKENTKEISCKLKNRRHPDIDKSQCGLNNNDIPFFEDLKDQNINSQDLQKLNGYCPEMDDFDNKKRILTQKKTKVLSTIRKFWVEIISKSDQDRYLRDIYLELKRKNSRISMKWIDQFLGGGRYSSYIKGARMPYDRFLKLKDLLIRSIPKEMLFELYRTHSGKTSKFDIEIIPHNIYLTIKDPIPYTPLPKTNDTAELISIMLGDGHLHPLNKDKVVQITLNRVDEERYFEYVGTLLKRIFPNSNFRIRHNRGKGFDWITTNSRIHYAICELGKGKKKTGLIPGNKVKNQVSEPEWVELNLSFIRKGLKGLFDTDGSITVGRNNQLSLSFSNSSKNLVKDFYFMSKKIGIKKIGNIVDAGQNLWRVAIYDSIEVKKFLNIIKPEKFKEPYRLWWLGLNIIYRRAPEISRMRILNELNGWRRKLGNIRAYFSYTKDNTDLLRDWVEKAFKDSNFKIVFGCKFDSSITYDMIKSALNSALLSQYDLISYSKRGNNKDYRVHWFPDNMRNVIIDFIMKNLDKEDSQIILSFFENMSSDSRLMALLNPFNENMYNIALKDYIESLVLVIKEINNRLKKDHNSNNIGHYSLETYFKNKGIHLAFSRKPIIKIIEYLIPKNNISNKRAS